MTDSQADGLLIIDKPSGFTSHDVIAKLRGILKERRIGHSGTLDPSATGVLLVGIGRFTRFLRYLTELPKSYEFEIVFGVATSTLDADGEIVSRFAMTLQSDEVQVAAEKFLGQISQTPPMVSAVKVGGKRLHELAREGKEVDRLPRLVTVYEFVTEPTAEAHVYRAKVSCSSGTYVRVLGAELGQTLGGGAHIRNLKRTQIGSFDLSEARTLEEVESARQQDRTAQVTQGSDSASSKGFTQLLTPIEALRDYTVVEITEADALAVRQGKRITVPVADDRIAVSCSGELVGVLVRAGDEFRPETVASY